jgi:hypothetical protein
MASTTLRAASCFGLALEYWMIVLRPIRISAPAFSQISGACCEIYDSHCVMMMNHLKHSVTLQVS